jgi:acetyltransferase
MFETLFQPRGVAIIGASENPTKLGYGVARNMVVSNYEGALYFVNPRGGRLFDRDIYKQVIDVPDPVDLAVILIPATSVPGALEECGKRGIPYVIIGSGGFRETGPEGKALEQQCLDIARRYNLRVLGPNCIGFLDTHLPIDTTFLPIPGPIQGDIAFLSHSGAICEAVIDWARGQGFGLSRLVSLGNQMDLTETELLAPTASDENTKVITMYLEGVGDGREFIRQARLVTDKIPVVAIKVGRSERGRAAVESHTGAMAGVDAAYDAAFEKSGVIRAQSSEEMFDWARALAWCNPPSGPNIAVLTNAGGPGALAVDAIDALGLEIADFSQKTRERLEGSLPAAASVRNPVDMLASAGPTEYANCLRALLADEGVDAVMVILPPPPMTSAAEVAGAIIPVVRSTEKPVVITLMGEELIARAATLFRQAHIPDYRFPERAASALNVLAQRAERFDKQHRPQPEVFAANKDEVEEALRNADVGKGGFLDPMMASKIASAYGIRTPVEELTRTDKEATAAAERVGYPVVLKIASSDLAHKSDVGGILLNLANKEQVVTGFKKLSEGMISEEPTRTDWSILVQRMVAYGQEVILGAVKDQQFGHLMMFGSGGIEVEGLNDVAFGLSPLTRSEAEGMIEKTWAGRKLRGFRNLEPADREAVVDALLKLSQMVEDFPHISEVEINPLKVLNEGEGVVAIDVRVRVNGGGLT